MSKVNLNAKFGIGEEVYTIVQKKFSMPCSMCNAKKVITYNNVTTKCPNCHGTGKFEVNKMIWSVVDTIHEVSTIKASINKCTTTVKYKVSPKTGFGATLNRCEASLFLTKSEAQHECDKRNEVHIDVKITDIKITTAFSNTIPDSDKIVKRVEEYKKHGKFDTSIVIDCKGYLVDGYSAYLVCKMLEVDTLRVTIR